MYVELHAASAFSFLEGASSPESLVERAVALGYPALALLDRDGVYGAPRFHLAAKAAGIRAIIGSELTIRSGGTLASGAPRPPQLWRLPVLVASRDGYKRLCRLVTRMKMRAAKGEGVLTLEDFEGETGGLVALVGRAALNVAHYGVGGLLDRVVGLFGRGQVYVELQRHLLRDQEADNDALRALASAFRVAVVATNGVRFGSEDERPLFDVLTCMRHATTLSRAGRRLAWNAERYLKAPADMAALFADVPEAVAATRDLADRLEYTMADLGYRFPDYPVPAGETQASFLRKIADVGARDRYRPYHDRARAQIARELDLIEKLDLAGYFLIVWDIVNFCRQHGILVQGRGSAANSAVCYSLGITAVDPVGMELLFERFLSEERGEWPDIDLDLPSGDRREQAIQYVYERYGKLGAAMTANVITYRGRSAAREVGKALEFDEATIGRLAKAMTPFEWRDAGETLARQLVDAGLDPAEPRLLQFADLWRRIQDLPRHLGQHSGGMVICQGRLDEVVPLEPAAMPGRVVIQWDKEDCADLGIVKVDLLGLGMMAALQDALAIVNGSGASQAPPPAVPSSGEHGHAPARADRQRTGASRQRPTDDSAADGRPVLDLAHLPPDDPEVYRMLQEADTVGVFQVESRAQMATLPRIKPAHFYDLVVEVAIIRPGPIVGQMVHPYIARRNGQERVVYPHPALEPILKRTLGVPLFQEQLLRMAMVAAGFSGGEAEELRRAMGFKRSEARMRQIETKLRAGMSRNGITGEAADGIVRSITSFALYGFPESHAASFALIVYASAYLKAHYPAAFCAALLNNQPMGFYHPATLVKDAQRRGVRFAPIDVQTSDWACRVEPDGRIRLGLMYVRGLREEVARRIEACGDASRAGGGRAGAGGLPSPATDGRRQAASAGGSAGGAHRAAGRDGSGAHGAGTSRAGDHPACPKCGVDDASMVEPVQDAHGTRWFCNVCAHLWEAGAVSAPGRERFEAHRVAPHVVAAVREAPADGGGAERFRSLDHFVAATGIRRDELATLAEVGALNAFGHDRRSALWQVERVVRPAGALFDEGGARGDGWALEGAGWTADAPLEQEGQGAEEQHAEPRRADGPAPERRTSGTGGNAPDAHRSPLRPMSAAERVVADYQGSGLTIGPHPMALRRGDLALRGVLRAVDLPVARAGRRVRIAGAVITRQRPGTAKGFAFLTLEDETGISNIIVRPDLFDTHRAVIVREPFLLIEGVLQQQEGVTSVRAERVASLPSAEPLPTPDSHDFH